MRGLGAGANANKRGVTFDAIVFDVYGTLFDIMSTSWAPPDVVTTLRRKQLEYSWLLSLMGAYVDFRSVTKLAIEYALDVHRFGGDVQAILDSQLHLDPFPEIPKALERLKVGRRLAILSNGHPDSLEALLVNTDLRRYFSVIVSVDEVRIFKPAPAVYQHLLDVIGLDQHRILFASSNGWDAVGAAAFGLRVVWVNRDRLPAERVGRPPELEVFDLTELADLL